MSLTLIDITVPHLQFILCYVLGQVTIINFNNSLCQMAQNEHLSITNFYFFLTISKQH